MNTDDVLTENVFGAEDVAYTRRWGEDIDGLCDSHEALRSLLVEETRRADAAEGVCTKLADALQRISAEVGLAREHGMDMGLTDYLQAIADAALSEFAGVGASAPLWVSPIVTDEPIPTAAELNRAAIPHAGTKWEGLPPGDYEA